MEFILCTTFFFTQINNVNSKQIVFIVKFGKFLATQSGLSLSYRPLLIAGFKILGTHSSFFGFSHLNRLNKRNLIVKICLCLERNKDLCLLAFYLTL